MSAAVKKVESPEVLNELTWKPWHDNLLKMTVEDKPVAEICLFLGKSSTQVNKARNSEYFRSKLSEIQKTVTQTITKTWLEAIDGDAVKAAREAIGKAAVEAAETIVWISRNGESDDKMRFEAAKDILDRAGVRAPEIVKQQKEERIYAPEEVLHAKKILEESEGIVKRLTNSPNRFVIGNECSAGSETDTAHGLPKVESD